MVSTSSSLGIPPLTSLRRDGIEVSVSDHDNDDNDDDDDDHTDYDDDDDHDHDNGDISPAHGLPSPIITNIAQQSHPHYRKVKSSIHSSRYHKFAKVAGRITDSLAIHGAPSHAVSALASLLISSKGVHLRPSSTHSHFPQFPQLPLTVSQSLVQGQLQPQSQDIQAAMTVSLKGSSVTTLPSLSSSYTRTKSDRGNESPPSTSPIYHARGPSLSLGMRYIAVISWNSFSFSSSSSSTNGGMAIHPRLRGQLMIIVKETIATVVSDAQSWTKGAKSPNPIMQDSTRGSCSTNNSSSGSNANKDIDDSNNASVPTGNTNDADINTRDSSVKGTSMENNIEQDRSTPSPAHDTTAENITNTSTNNATTAEDDIPINSVSSPSITTNWASPIDGWTILPNGHIVIIGRNSLVLASLTMEVRRRIATLSALPAVNSCAYIDTSIANDFAQMGSNCGLALSSSSSSSTSSSTQQNLASPTATSSAPPSTDTNPPTQPSDSTWSSLSNHDVCVAESLLYPGSTSLYPSLNASTSMSNTSNVLPSSAYIPNSGYSSITHFSFPSPVSSSLTPSSSTSITSSSSSSVSSTSISSLPLSSWLTHPAISAALLPPSFQLKLMQSLPQPIQVSSLSLPIIYSPYNYRHRTIQSPPPPHTPPTTHFPPSSSMHNGMPVSTAVHIASVAGLATFMSWFRGFFTSALTHVDMPPAHDMTVSIIIHAAPCRMARVHSGCGSGEAYFNYPPALQPFLNESEVINEQHNTASSMNPTSVNDPLDYYVEGTGQDPLTYPPPPSHSYPGKFGTSATTSALMNCFEVAGLGLDEATFMADYHVPPGCLYITQPFAAILESGGGGWIEDGIVDKLPSTASLTAAFIAKNGHSAPAPGLPQTLAERGEMNSNGNSMCELPTSMTPQYSGSHDVNGNHDNSSSHTVIVSKPTTYTDLGGTSHVTGVTNNNQSYHPFPNQSATSKSLVPTLKTTTTLSMTAVGTMIGSYLIKKLNVSEFDVMRVPIYSTTKVELTGRAAYQLAIKCQEMYAQVLQRLSEMKQKREAKQRTLVNRSGKSDNNLGNNRSSNPTDGMLMTGIISSDSDSDTTSSPSSSSSPRPPSDVEGKKDTSGEKIHPQEKDEGTTKKKTDGSEVEKKITMKQQRKKKKPVVSVNDNADNDGQNDSDGEEGRSLSDDGYTDEEPEEESTLVSSPLSSSSASIGTSETSMHDGQENANKAIQTATDNLEKTMLKAQVQSFRSTVGDAEYLRARLARELLTARQLPVRFTFQMKESAVAVLPNGKVIPLYALDDHPFV